MMLIFGIILLSISQIFAFNTTDCDGTKYCLFAHNTTELNCDKSETDKDSKSYCHFAMSYQLLEDEPDYVLIELRRPRYNDTLQHKSVYVAMGLSYDNIMGNDSVVQCYFNESASFDDKMPFELFLSWNENHDNGTEKSRTNILLPTEYDYNNTEKTYNIKPVSGLITESMFVCTFKRRIRPIISHISPEWHDFWDLNGTYNIFMAFGNVNHENGRLLYHGNNKVIIAENTNLVAAPPHRQAPPGECGNTMRCFGYPVGCDMKVKNQMNSKYCRSRLYVTPANSDGTVTMELYATRLNLLEFGGRQSYVAAGFSKSDRMINASVVHCVFDEDGDYVGAYQSYNFLDTSTNASHYNNKVLPEETGNSTSAQNVMLKKRQSDDNYYSCTVTRKISPLAEANQKAEVFPLNQEYTLIMAWGRAASAKGGQLTYHFTNRGVVSEKPVDVTKPLKQTASTAALSFFTSLSAIGIYLLLKN